MRLRRLKAPAAHPIAYYHCLSRVVNRDFVFGPTEKEWACLEKLDSKKG